MHRLFRWIGKKSKVMLNYAWCGVRKLKSNELPWFQGNFLSLEGNFPLKGFTFTIFVWKTRKIWFNLDLDEISVCCGNDSFFGISWGFWKLFWGVKGWRSIEREPDRLPFPSSFRGKLLNFGGVMAEGGVALPLRKARSQQKTSNLQDCIRSRCGTRFPCLPSN